MTEQKKIERFIQNNMEDMKRLADARDLKSPSEQEVYNNLIDDTFHEITGALIFAYIYTNELTDEEFTALNEEICEQHTEYRWR